MATVFDLLDEIRKRPTVYVGYDESKRALQLQGLEMLLAGYGMALYYHNIKEPISSFNRKFGEYLYETKGWSASCGPVAAIREAAKSDEGAWVLYWKMVDKFRSTIEAAQTAREGDATTSISGVNHMPSVFDLLDDIEKRPGMYLGWGPEERGKQLLTLEAILMGYSHAVSMHGIDDPGKDFFETFIHFLQKRYGWSGELGPIGEIRSHAASDEEAWSMVWKLIREFRSAESEQRRTP